MLCAVPLGPGDPFSPLSEAARLAIKSKKKADSYETLSYSIFAINTILFIFYIHIIRFINF